MDRREFLKLSGVAGLACLDAPVASATDDLTGQNLKLRISPVSLEIGPGKVIKTVGYNGSVPGPIVRFREGRPVNVDVYNDTDVPEVVHWHGQAIAPKVDGSTEERTPPVPPGGHRRYSFTPGPTGTRWYHTHSMAHANLTRAFPDSTDLRSSSRRGTRAITTRKSASLCINGSRPSEPWVLPTTVGRSCTARPPSIQECSEPASRFV